MNAKTANHSATATRAGQRGSVVLETLTAMAAAVAVILVVSAIIIFIGAD